MEKDSKIILVDFDGTCIPALPQGVITSYDTGASKVLKALASGGHRLVLWTARNNSLDNPYNYTPLGIFRAQGSLDEAVEWFRAHEIPLFGVNEVPGEKELVGTSRKALGDYLIDDTSLGIPLKRVKILVTSEDSGVTKFLDTYHVSWEMIEVFAREQKLIK